MQISHETPVVICYAFLGENVITMFNQFILILFLYTNLLIKYFQLAKRKLKLCLEKLENIIDICELKREILHQTFYFVLKQG